MNITSIPLCLVYAQLVQSNFKEEMLLSGDIVIAKLAMGN